MNYHIVDKPEFAVKILNQTVQCCLVVGVAVQRDHYTQEVVTLLGVFPKCGKSLGQWCCLHFGNKENIGR